MLPGYPLFGRRDIENSFSTDLNLRHTLSS